MHFKMTFYLITTLFGIGFFAVISTASPITGVNDAALFLRQFGYIEQPAYQDISAVSYQEVSAAIRDFQKFAGLQQTGTLNTETINMMNKPRCGKKDKTTHSQSRRKKRYALQGSKWHKDEISYNINNYPTRKYGNVRNEEYKNEIVRGLRAWSDVAKIDFKENHQGTADIDIKFVAGNHGDWQKFKGPGGVIAHAAFPDSGGDVHFDDDETWSINSPYGTDMFQTAAHEFGHSLGLLHSTEAKAIMYPYIAYTPGFQLHSDDINAIRAIYGPRDQRTSSDDENLGPQPDTRDAPNLCQDATIDTMVRVKSGSTYVFKALKTRPSGSFEGVGNFYWKVLSAGGFASGYPRKISEDWAGLEGNLDAALNWNDGTTYFFKGNRYWRFLNRNSYSGYPKYISEGWQGIPDNLDAAFIWGKNGIAYFFKGDKYWRYDYSSNPPVSAGYPQPTSAWSSMLTSGLDAALQWENGKTYFFKGGQYYRYNDETEQIDDNNPPYPLSTASMWFNCA